MANVFIKISQPWNKDARENGPLECWLTSVGHSPEMLPNSFTGDGRRIEVYNFIFTGINRRPFGIGMHAFQDVKL